jgi:hypothetical protein
MRISLDARTRKVALQPLEPSTVGLGEVVYDSDQIRLKSLVDSRDHSLSLLDAVDLGVSKFLLLLAVPVPEECDHAITLLFDSLQRLSNLVEDHFLNRGVFGKVDRVDQGL